MKVSRMELKGVLKHKDTSLNLPDSGVVLVTGSNGAGKSSFVEAVSMACWGKTLRGSSGWNKAEKKAEVFVRADGYEVTRRNYSSERLEIDLDESQGVLPIYEKKSLTQNTIDSVFGTYEVWRRTAVFSSSDAANFTSATDKERKNLLEALLGLDIFDRSQALAAERYAKANLELVDAQRDLAKANMEAKYAGDNLEKAEVAVAGSRAALAPEGRADAAIVADVEMLENRWEHKLSVLRDLEKKYDVAVREYWRLRDACDATNCPTCGQVTKHGTIDRSSVTEAEAKAAALLEHVQLHKALLQTDTTLDEIKELRNEQIAAHAARCQNKAIKKLLETAEADLAAAETRLNLAAMAVSAAEYTHTVAKHSVAVATAVQKVMGPKGLRSQVLGRAIAGTEARANYYLSKLAGPEFRLKLSSTKENKTGGVRDELSLEVSGAGGGEGYKGASAGERRRIDVALLFALADVSAAAHGAQPGTLFVDEAFDALDAAGTEAVVELLNEISRDRCVFVITHSEDLAKRLSPVQTVHVHDGRVC